MVVKHAGQGLSEHQADLMSDLFGRESERQGGQIPGGMPKSEVPVIAKI